MRRNCSLELRLLPSSGFDLPAADHGEHHRRRHHHIHHHMMEESSESAQDNQQQLTIFYNGNVCVCDVTELQARSILLLANREMEERMKTQTGQGPTSPALQSPLYSPTAPTYGGLSMKRSLQRFLQKRKNRLQATSPYNQ